MRGFVIVLLLALLGASIPLAAATNPGCVAQLGVAHVCVFDREFGEGCPSARHGAEETAVLVWLVAAGASVDAARWCYGSSENSVNAHGVHAFVGALFVGGVIVVWNQYETPQEECSFAIDVGVAGEDRWIYPPCPTSPPEGPWGHALP